MTSEELIKIAFAARKYAYAPYSHFKVGAALLTKSNRVYTGCNIENASFPVGLCAERVAISKAISEGDKELLKIAIVGGNENIEEPKDYCTPCGICRQTMAEFCDNNFEIILFDNGEPRIFSLDQMLPHSFNKDDLKK